MFWFDSSFAKNARHAEQFKHKNVLTYSIYACVGACVHARLHVCTYICSSIEVDFVVTKYKGTHFMFMALLY